MNRHDHPHVISGQGTIGLEIIDQVCNVDAVVLPVGGGGLLAGVALAVKRVYPDVQIIVSLIIPATVLTSKLTASRNTFFSSE